MEQEKQAEQLPSVKELIKGNLVKFSHYRSENFYYNIEQDWEQDPESRQDPFLTSYQFPVDVDDIGNATLLAEDKAITFMRWIRAARENGTLIKL